MNFESQPYDNTKPTIVLLWNHRGSYHTQVTNGLVLVVKRTNEPSMSYSLCKSGQESEPTNRERRIAMKGLEKSFSPHTPQPLYRYLKYIEI